MSRNIKQLEECRAGLYTSLNVELARTARTTHERGLGHRLRTLLGRDQSDPARLRHYLEVGSRPERKSI